MGAVPDREPSQKVPHPTTPKNSGSRSRLLNSLDIEVLWAQYRFYGDALKALDMRKLVWYHEHGLIHLRKVYHDNGQEFPGQDAAEAEGVEH